MGLPTEPTIFFSHRLQGDGETLSQNIPLWRNTSLSLAPAGRPCLNCRPLIAGSFRWPSGGQLPSKASHWSGGSRDRGSDWSRDRFAGSWLDGSEEWRTLIGWERQMLLWERRRRGSTCQDHFMRTCFKFGQCGFVKAFYALNLMKNTMISTLTKFIRKMPEM